MIKPVKIFRQQDIKTARDAFFAVFKSSFTFADPFQETVEEKIILYNALYQLDEDHYRALGEITFDLYNSNTAFLSVTEGKKEKGFYEDRSWIIDLRRYPYGAFSQEEKDLTALMETAIYSKEGSWGIVFSEYGHAIMGGSHLFVDSVRKKIPEIDHEIFDFLNDVKEEVTLSPRTIKYFQGWLPGLLTNIYGEGRALEMQEKVGLDLLFKAQNDSTSHK